MEVKKHLFLSDHEVNISCCFSFSSAEGIRLAAECGVRSIEHASFIDESGIDMCLLNNVWIVPTFSIGEIYEKEGSPSGMQDRFIDFFFSSSFLFLMLASFLILFFFGDFSMIDLTRSTKARNFQCINAAYKRGVRIALGSDIVGTPPQWNAREFRYMVERAGMR